MQASSLDERETILTLDQANAYLVQEEAREGKEETPSKELCGNVYCIFVLISHVWMTPKIA